MSLRARALSAARQVAGIAAHALGAFAYSPPAVPGAGQPMQAFAPSLDARQKRIIGSRDALFGITSYYAGPTPTAFSTYPGSGLNPQALTSIVQQVRASGIMTLKADLDEQLLMTEPHTRSVDGARRVAVTGKPFRVRPSDGSPIAVANAKYIQAACDKIESFDGAWYGLLQANAAGFKTAETAYRPDTTVRFKVGDKTLVIRGPHPKTIVEVHNKHIKFDVGTDQPWLDLGVRSIPIRPPERLPIDAFDYDQFKYIYHVTAGDGQARMRGYMYPCHWPIMIKRQAVARLAAVLNIWGIPVPWVTVPQDLYENVEKKIQADRIAAAHGQGAPVVTTDDLKLQPTPTPPNLDARGMHMACIGLCNTEISKAVQGETLTTEVGSVAGSYALSGTHENTKESIIAQDALDLANTLRAYLFLSILYLNLHELCRAYNNAGISCTPDDILAHVPRPFWVISRSMTPAVQVQLAKDCVNELGMRIDLPWFADSVGMVLATDDGTAIKGKPTEVKQGGETVGAVRAAEGKVGPPDENSGGVTSDSAPSSGSGAAELTPSAQSEVIKFNEGREMLNLPKVAGGDDRYISQGAPGAGTSAIAKDGE